MEKPREALNPSMDGVHPTNKNFYPNISFQRELQPKISNPKNENIAEKQ